MGRYMSICINKDLLSEQLAYLANYDLSIGTVEEEEIPKDTPEEHKPSHNDKSEFDRYEHDEWWYRSTIRQNVLLLPWCSHQWEIPGIVNGVGLSLDEGEVVSKYE